MDGSPANWHYWGTFGDLTWLRIGNAYFGVDLHSLWTQNPGTNRKNTSGGKFVSTEGIMKWIEGNSENRAILLAKNEPKTYWFFRRELYYETDRLNQDAVTTLLLAKEKMKQKRIDRAKARIESVESTRQPIPSEVRMFVWQRDEGKCVECGSKEKLEFDHIIPISMGGGSTARNIQILCEICNREKGGNIV